MDKQEFFLLIPAIIYGVAIVDLLKIFGHKKNYIEMMGWGLYVMMSVIFLWTELYTKLDLIVASQLNFFLIIAQAIMLAMLARTITPEEKDVDTKAYFFSIRKKFFILAAASVSYNVILSYTLYVDERALWIRLFAIALYLVVGFSNKFWIRITILAFVLVMAILTIFTSTFVEP